MDEEARKRVVASLPGLDEARLRLYEDSARFYELIVRLVHAAEGFQPWVEEARSPREVPTP